MRVHFELLGKFDARQVTRELTTIPRVGDHVEAPWWGSNDVLVVRVVIWDIDGEQVYVRLQQ